MNIFGDPGFLTEKGILLDAERIVNFSPSGLLSLGSSCRSTASIQAPQAMPAGD